LEAEVLLKSCLGIENVELYLNPDRHLSRYELNFLKDAVKKRKSLLSLAHITGKKGFYSLEFRVTPDTFIPRPETEFIVDAVLELSGSRVAGRGSSKTISDRAKRATSDELIIVDLGTGCGNIAITLAGYIPNSRIYATDISKGALEVAKENAKRHSVEDRITFLEGDLFSPFKKRHLEEKVDFLVSNPPYIVKREIDSLMPEVAYHEPRIALDGGEDGFSFYRRIIEGAPEYLKPQGYLVLELGIDQVSRVKEMIEKTSKFESIEIIKDYSEIDRVIITQRS